MGDTYRLDPPISQPELIGKTKNPAPILELRHRAAEYCQKDQEWGK